MESKYPSIVFLNIIMFDAVKDWARRRIRHVITTCACNTADTQLNAKSRLSKDVRMQHFRFHNEDAINVNKVYLFRIY